MYRNNNNNGAVVGNTRRAFRDVTNSTRNLDERNVAKNGVVNVDKPNAAVPQIRLEVQPRQHSYPTRSQQQPQANPASYQYSGQIDNIDERDATDPLCATEYVGEMYEHFRLKETATSVRPVYMENQPHINERMRSILVDWLVEVHLKFKLVPETLYLTINLIDRFLERKEVSRKVLQLVGVTSLLIASKYEEIYPPELRDLVYICDRAYGKDEIIAMEENILKTLEYQITIPSAHAFLVRYLKAAHADKRIVQLSCYVLDGTLQSYNLLHYLPSQLAAAAVYIARRTVGRNAWSPTLLKYANYCEEEIEPVARAVLNEKSGSSDELKAVNKKYSSSRYGSVATIPLSCDM
mmetsp:Transcript_46037/g.68555  ORF Transcript_46037/g.68555 Transcript_46037/m.68555 type:complete len:351 (-) Transcript_46037:359-1411(-)|eukprot:CAMPEP_0194035434 /NCGR_PEP_ID=MMETSP0009_2-20130614/7856_1 /TAXON_ID=210454 /ORGANISM="Grammatophora oceanica, Strain CCMP 410" /LENGTH=350 /DNA_ID=CAMNT_0038676779 /DNA_START=141 /DNA_END=1193 /DNA_ORIENTATION=+